MARLELMLVGVLIAIALLIGILFGGSSIWFLKPAGGDQVVEKTLMKYVCSDGTVKDAQSDCPTIAVGTSTVVCPPCGSKNVTDTNPFRRCDCVQCTAQCGGEGVVTATTIAQPVCKACAANADCGQPAYGDIKCKNSEEYKMYQEPTCEKSCCMVKETYNKIQDCTSSQRCRPGQGCVAYDDTTEE
jgi:hypothetical protein